MPTFTPPTTTESSSDLFFGRYRVPVGISVIWDGTTFISQPYPWLGDLVDLVEGETWFQGGRTYQVDDITAGKLQNAGFVCDRLGYGEALYGIQGYGGNL